MKTVKILAIAAIAGVMGTSAAMAQTTYSTTYSQSYVQHQGGKQTSSRAEYRATKLRPYNGDSAPISDD